MTDGGTTSERTLICTVCGDEYQPRHVRKDGKFCSLRCKDRAGGRKRRAQLKLSTCSIDGCSRQPRWDNGLCGMHYRRNRLTGSPGSAESLRGGICGVEGCERPHYSKRLCLMHYGRVRDTGETGPAEPKKAANNKGTGPWRYTSRGYVYLRWPDGRRAAEHRYVMERVLGRPLYRDETPHHKYGDRSDNRPESLELWSTWQPAGQRVEDKVQWAKELLARYKPEALASTQLSV